MSARSASCSIVAVSPSSRSAASTDDSSASTCCSGAAGVPGCIFGSPCRPLHFDSVLAASPVACAAAAGVPYCASTRTYCSLSCHHRSGRDAFSDKDLRLLARRQGAGNLPPPWTGIVGSRRPLRRLDPPGGRGDKRGERGRRLRRHVQAEHAGDPDEQDRDGAGRARGLHLRVEVHPMMPCEQSSTPSSSPTMKITRSLTFIRPPS